MIKKVILSFCLILFSVSASATPFDDAVKSFEAGNYQVAFDEFKLLSEMGNKQAQFNLGFMYVDGSGIAQDLVKGYAWIKLSDEGNESPDELLAKIEPHFSEEQKQQANSLYEELYAQYSIEKMMLGLKPVFKAIEQKKLRPQQVRIIKSVKPKYPGRALMAEVIGYTTLSFKLNANGRAGDIIVEDSVPSKVFDKSAKQALKQWIFDTDGADLEQRRIYKLGYTLGDYKFWNPDRGVNLSKAKLKSIKDEAEKGDGMSQYLLAKYSRRYQGGAGNPTEWYYKSAQQGVIEAQYELGISLLNGIGCEQDKEKGLEWLLRSASGDYTKSQLKVAQYYKDLGEDEKYTLWLRKSLESNDASYAMELAKHIVENEPDGFEYQDAWNQLNLIMSDQDVFGYELYVLYAKVAYEVGEFELAVKYQGKINRMLRGVRLLSAEYSDALSLYKDAL